MSDLVRCNWPAIGGLSSPDGPRDCSKILAGIRDAGVVYTVERRHERLGIAVRYRPVYRDASRKDDAAEITPRTQPRASGLKGRLSDAENYPKDSLAPWSHDMCARSVQPTKSRSWETDQSGLRSAVARRSLRSASVIGSVLPRPEAI